jgi:catalase
MTDAFEEYAKNATQPGSALPEAKEGGHPNPGSRDGHSRRSLLTAIGRLSLAGAVVQAVSSSALASPAVAKAASGEAGEKAFEATADKVIDALEGAYGVNPGKRRNHTKGFGALGSFVGSSVAAAYSRSPLFSGQEIQVVARFSVAGGDPAASDAERSARGIGLEFRLPGGDLHHITMLHTPMFFATMPKTFLDKFMALKPDAATGKPDPAKIGVFLKSHPDNAAQFHFVQVNNPPPSYANCAFYGIHTFKFVNADNKVTMVRFRFVPRDGQKQLSDADLKSAPNDFLERAFNDRVGQGPVRWDMMVTIGQPGDSEDDPTILWPTDRKEFNAGTLTLASAMPDQTAGSYKINFDPLMMADGIEPTNDPILLFRSPSYAVSHTRRLRNL